MQLCCLVPNAINLCEHTYTRALGADVARHQRLFVVVVETLMAVDHVPSLAHCPTALRRAALAGPVLCST
jgi:hypothetical protein